MLRGSISSTPFIILSNKGVMQGCISGMILYGIGHLPLAKDLCRKDPSFLQHWYANSLALEGPASKVTQHFQRLCQHGPDIGYFPSGAKSNGICLRASEPAAKATFVAANLPMQFSCRQCYIGGFNGFLAKCDR